jgi:hypothetical protein
MWNHPSVVTQYDADTDSVVMLLHHSTPRRRLRSVKETVLDVSSCVRPDFPVWRSWQPAFVLPEVEAEAAPADGA